MRGTGAAAPGVTRGAVVDVGAEVGDAEVEDAGVDEAEEEAGVTRGEPGCDGFVHAVAVTRTTATSRLVGRGRITHANPTLRWITGAGCR